MYGYWLHLDYNEQWQSRILAKFISSLNEPIKQKDIT